eukprot:g27746.t1
MWHCDARAGALDLTSALYYAAIGGAGAEVVNRLVTRRADVNAQSDEHYQRTAMMRTLFKVKLLQHRFQKVTMVSKIFYHSKGASPLMIALLTGHHEYPALLMVSCCIMGRPWAPVQFPRQPLSQLGQDLEICLPRSALKMANLWAPGAVPEEKIVTRLALRWLLAARGWHNESQAPDCTSLTPSMRGVTRSHLKAGFASVARRALELRSLTDASPEELGQALRWGQEVSVLYRRLELLTPLIGEEADRLTLLGRMFPKASSPRNLAIYAQPRLPRRSKKVGPTSGGTFWTTNCEQARRPWLVRLVPVPWLRGV